MQMSRTPRRWLVGAGALLVGLWVGPQALGYAIEVHKDFYDMAFGGREAGKSVSPPTATSLTSFRLFVYQRAAKNPAFRKRWPNEASFTTAAFKEFLALNPDRQVVAIDTVPANRPTDIRTVVREGSVDPDNDHRNQDRVFTRGGKVMLDAFGRAVPDDPRTTWFGGLTGTPSQFDAHGATLRTGKKGGGLMTAIRHPEQFARPPVPLGSAPDFSETYTELSMIAKLWGGEGHEWLALTYGGNNLHGIEDLGNQIHTTVLGTWQFFADAKWVAWKQRAKRWFSRKRSAPDGRFGPPASLTPAEIEAALALIRADKLDQVDPKVRWAIGKEPKPAPSDTELGILIIGNHHRLLEDFVQDQYLKGRDLIRGNRASEARPEVRELLKVAIAGDVVFEKACRAALKQAGLGTSAKGQTPYAQVIAEVMITHSAPEAQPIYKAIRKISKKGLKRGETYDKGLGHDPLEYVTKSTPKNKHVKTIWNLTGKAFARVVTAIRLWDEVYTQEIAGVTPGSPAAKARAEAIVDRLVGRQLGYLAAKETRRAEYLATKATEAREAGIVPADTSGLIKAVDGQ